jgi:hypothetical protein
MRHWCDCKCTIRVGSGDGILTLERCGLHDMNRHARDKSKYLKYNQMATVTVPNLSVSVIRRNLLLHGSPTKTIDVHRQHYQNVTRRVRRARKNLTAAARQCIIGRLFRSLNGFLLQQGMTRARAQAK